MDDQLLGRSQQAVELQVFLSELGKRRGLVLLRDLLQCHRDFGTGDAATVGLHQPELHKERVGGLPVSAFQHGILDFHIF